MCLTFRYVVYSWMLGLYRCNLLLIDFIVKQRIICVIRDLMWCTLLCCVCWKFEILSFVFYSSAKKVILYCYAFVNTVCFFYIPWFFLFLAHLRDSVKDDFHPNRLGLPMYCFCWLLLDSVDLGHGFISCKFRLDY
jgi:hypothetical protein